MPDWDDMSDRGTMSDRDDVRDAVTRMLHAIDALDWPGVEAAFADELRIDYSSLFDGEPETVTTAELIARWRGLLPGFDATQHMTGPVIVSISAEGGAASADTHVRGYHHIADAQGGSVWQVAGHYIMELVKQADRWKITSLTLHLLPGRQPVPAGPRRRDEAHPQPHVGAGEVDRGVGAGGGHRLPNPEALLHGGEHRDTQRDHELDQHPPVPHQPPIGYLTTPPAR
ncbi:MAG: nuclear transport factor 2 family protein [Pseudonocardiaceae bacterium]